MQVVIKNTTVRNLRTLDFIHTKTIFGSGIDPSVQEKKSYGIDHRRMVHTNQSNMEV